MEDVLKMTYKELYYFKKALKETGQKLLAKLVTVRLPDHSELSYDDI